MADIDRRRWVSPVLLGIALLLLGMGRFIQFGDTSGFGHSKILMSLALPAAAAAVASFVIAARQAATSRLLGGVVLLLSLVLAAFASIDVGFRFIWENDEAELWMLVVFLWLAGNAYLMRSIVGQPPSLGKKLVIALFVTSAVVFALVVLLIAYVLWVCQTGCFN